MGDRARAGNSETPLLVQSNRWQASALGHDFALSDDAIAPIAVIWDRSPSRRQ